MKRCSKCGETKAHEQFYKQPDSSPTKDGLTYQCKSCYAAYYRANRERHKLSVRRNRARTRYGLSLEEYDALIEEGCRVCGSRKRVFIDHCHATNRVRAPLCSGCNLALGAVGDDPDRLEALARFLRAGDFVGTTPLPVGTSGPQYLGPTVVELRRMYEDEGLSLNAIAKRIGWSRDPVRIRLLAAGVKFRPKRQDVDDDEIVRLYVDEKLSLEEVGARVGMGSGGVLRRLRLRGVPRRSAGGASHASRLRA